MSDASRVETERFRGIVADRMGLWFEDARLGFLAEILRGRLDATNRSGEAYLRALEAASAHAELAALAQELTVPETYFFRHNDQFRAFVEIALMERMRTRAASRTLRLLSAGCASGEEAYSLAILVREHVLDPSWTVSILAVDVNPVVLEKAERARFSGWALRETPPEVQRRWFQMDGRDAVLDDAVRSAVEFRERNLLDDDAALWQPDVYDVVFCRNVLMYFTPERAQRVVRRITTALAPGGYLFLGHAETLRGLSLDFHLRHTHETFYYQRRDRLEAHPVPLAPVPPPGAPSAGASDAWIEGIRRASDRVRTLTESPRRTISPESENTRAQPRSDLGRVHELLRQERFSDALELVDALPSEVERDPDLLLLRAVLVTHRGQLAEAETLCRTLLEVDDLNAGAHYVLALCREGSGDLGSAVEHDQVAIYLDPTFAMPRVHLGLLARRRGDHDTARRELGHALVLLRREGASRLLLFGGGFGREALLALCQAELVMCGGHP